MKLHGLAGLIVMAAFATPTIAQQSIFEIYGTREVAPCAPMTEVAGAGPVLADLEFTLRCATEKVDDYWGEITFLEDMKLTLGEAAKYDLFVHKGLKSPDYDRPVYPYSGTLTWVLCYKITERYPLGKNCLERRPSEVSGVLYWTAKGELSATLNYDTWPDGVYTGPRPLPQ